MMDRKRFVELLFTEKRDNPLYNAEGEAPPAMGAREFVMSHDHYWGYITDILPMEDLIDLLREHVHEHGHHGRMAIISPWKASVARYLGVPGNDLEWVCIDECPEGYVGVCTFKSFIRATDDDGPMATAGEAAVACTLHASWRNFEPAGDPA